MRAGGPVTPAPAVFKSRNRNTVSERCPAYLAAGTTIETLPDSIRPLHTELSVTS
jgi:hypothetical protein